jgi:vacuolar protein sorting-associated protein 18
MDEYSKNAESLKTESRMIKNKYIEIDANKKCEECSNSVFTKEGYFFPCMHSFHKDCLIRRVTDPDRKRKIQNYD